MLGTLELPKGRLELGGVQGPRAGDRVRSRQSGGRGGKTPESPERHEAGEARGRLSRGGGCTGLHAPIVVTAAHGSRTEELNSPPPAA